MSLLLSTLLKCSINLRHFQQPGTGQPERPSRSTPGASLPGADNPHLVCSWQTPPSQTAYRHRQETAGASSPDGEVPPCAKTKPLPTGARSVSLPSLVGALGHEYRQGGPQRGHPNSAALLLFLKSYFTSRLHEQVLALGRDTGLNYPGAGVAKKNRDSPACAKESCWKRNKISPYFN